MKIADFRERADTLGREVGIKEGQSIGDYLGLMGNKYGLFIQYRLRKPGVGLKYLGKVYKMLDLASGYIDEDGLGDNTNRAKSKIADLKRVIGDYVHNQRDFRTLSSMSDNIDNLLKLIDGTVEG